MKTFESFKLKNSDLNGIQLLNKLMMSTQKYKTKNLKLVTHLTNTVS